MSMSRPGPHTLEREFKRNEMVRARTKLYERSHVRHKYATRASWPCLKRPYHPRIGKGRYTYGD